MSLMITALVLALMWAESRLSRSNERALREAGAHEPPGDVYRLMAWAYPAAFIAMGIEGALAGPPPRGVFAAGAVVFAAGKAIKYWAIAALGRRWTFRVLVLPGAPLVARGPYAWLRHPNYVGVVGELAGVALAAGAPVTGVAAAVGFGALLRRRIVMEDRALGRDRAAAKGV